MQAFAHTRALSYTVAIIVAVAFVYYAYGLYYQPQPQVGMAYNAISQTGQGYINNTLSYPIIVSRIYCTAPNYGRIEFNNSEGSSLQPGSNTFIVIQLSGSSKLPANCTDWGVVYTKGSAQTGNAPTFVQTGSNSFTVQNGIK